MQLIKPKIKRGSLLWYAVLFPFRLKEKGLGFLTGYLDYLAIKRANEKKLKNRTLQPDCITVVITSAGRKEYLQQTIESLRRHLVYDPGKVHWYIIDDYPASVETRQYIESLPNFDLKIFNPKNMGLGYSLNKIYVEVKTEFVFHCEDDWLFIKPVPVAELIQVLRDNPHLRQLCLYRVPDPRKPKLNVRMTNQGFVEYERKFGFVPHLARTQLYIDHQPIPLDYAELEYTLKLERAGRRITGIYGYPDQQFHIHLGDQRIATKY